MRKLVFVISFVLLAVNVVFSDNFECSSALPFCLDTPMTFSATTGNSSGEPGPFYACLASQPNPSWFYCKVGQSGSIEITITSNPSNDVDFICWGPFSEPNACGSLTEDKVVDCSYSGGVPEICVIPNGIQGQYYYLIIYLGSLSETRRSIMPVGRFFGMRPGASQSVLTRTGDWNLAVRSFLPTLCRFSHCSLRYLRSGYQKHFNI